MADNCGYCATAHEARWLCDAGKHVLDALVERGMAMNMPTLEFPEPIPMSQQAALTGIDELVGQLVVLAAAVEVAGVTRPALVLTGKTGHGRDMPRYLYPGSPEDLWAVVKLVADMVAAAVRVAAEQDPAAGGEALRKHKSQAAALAAWEAIAAGEVGEDAAEARDYPAWMEAQLPHKTAFDRVFEALGAAAIARPARLLPIGVRLLRDLGLGPVENIDLSVGRPT